MVTTEQREQELVEAIQTAGDILARSEMKLAGERILSVLKLIKEGDISYEGGHENIKNIAQSLLNK